MPPSPHHLRGGADRLASLSLYKALLGQCRQTTFQDEVNDKLRAVLRNTFRNNKRISGKQNVKTAFYAGYEVGSPVLLVISRSETNRTQRIGSRCAETLKQRRSSCFKYHPPPAFSAASSPNQATLGASHSNTAPFAEAAHCLQLPLPHVPPSSSSATHTTLKPHLQHSPPPASPRRPPAQSPPPHPHLRRRERHPLFTNQKARSQLPLRLHLQAHREAADAHKQDGTL